MGFGMCGATVISSGPQPQTPAQALAALPTEHSPGSSSTLRKARTARHTAAAQREPHCESIAVRYRALRQQYDALHTPLDPARGRAFLRQLGWAGSRRLLSFFEMTQQCSQLHSTLRAL